MSGGVDSSVAALLLAVMAWAVIDEFGSSVIEEPAAPMATTAISDVFLREGLVPFLALSFVLLAAAIGAIVLARKD